MRVFRRWTSSRVVAVLAPRGPARGAEFKRSERFRMTPASRSFGLDISSTSVEGMELVWRRKTGYELKVYNRVLLPKGVIVDGEIQKPDILRSALKSLLDGVRPERFSRTAVVALPEAKVYLHTFEFPVSMREDQARAAIPFEVEGVLPVELKDMETDMLFHRSRERKTQHVLFTAVPRRLVEEYVTFLASVGIEAVAFDTESASLARSLVGLRSDPVMIADIGGHRTTLIVVERGAVHGAVSIPTGGITITEAVAGVTGQSFEAAENTKQTVGVTEEAPPPVREASEEAFKPVLQEAKQLLRSHEAHTGRAVRTIVLAGGTALLPGLDRWIAEATERDVLVGDPFAIPRIRFSPRLPPADVEWLQRGRLFFAVSVGLAMRGSRFDPSHGGLNLLPMALRRRYLLWRETLTLTSMSMIVAAVCTVLLFLLGTEMLRTQFAGGRVRAEVEPIRAAIAGERFASAMTEANAANREAEIIQAFSLQVVDPVNVLRSLRSLVPPTVRLSSVDFAVPAGSVTSLTVKIRGIAATREDFLSFERSVRSLRGVRSIDSPLENLDRPTAVPFSLVLTVEVSSLP